MRSYLFLEEEWDGGGGGSRDSILLLTRDSGLLAIPAHFLPTFNEKRALTRDSTSFPHYF